MLPHRSGTRLAEKMDLRTDFGVCPRSAGPHLCLPYSFLHPTSPSCSKSMARNCSAEAAKRDMRSGYVDLGVTDGDAHTSFSSDPKKTARNAFVDFLLLLDAAVVVRTGSSFSGMAAAIKGLTCSEAAVSAETPVSGVYVCVPPGGCW